LRGDRFTCPGSPLHGRVVPTDWKLLDPAGKRARCVALGWASDLYDAARLLAKHGAAASKGRKARDAAAERARAGARWWDN
jgi:hypothetical protein